MKRIWALLLAVTLSLLLAACGGMSAEERQNDSDALSTSFDAVASDADAAGDQKNSSVTIKQSPDKYTWYIKNYVGKNCASIGYTSLGGDRMDSYGEGLLELVFVSPDGTYIDIESDDALKEYAVTGQNLAPDTELKLTFETDSEGNEYDGLVAWQNFEEIVLSVQKIGDREESTAALTPINPSPDKYTWYVNDYVGRNLANCGYISLGGNLMARYGAAVVELVIVADDGSYVDSSDAELLKNYVVTEQNIAPNTELTLTMEKDSEGNEYDNLVETQNIEEIELYVSKIAEAEPAPEEEAEAPADTPEPEAEAESDEELVDGMRPAFKEAMDSYEAFYDEYCAFMKTYDENAGDFAMLVQYGELVARAAEMDEKFNAWDEDEMNDTELGYYLEVNGRVLRKLADVME